MHMMKNIESLPTDPKTLRNICILAHVDHGKTTLVDHLVASNKIITESIAGKVHCTLMKFRFMDSREDEQERGITMKSSCVRIKYKLNDQEYHVNVVDTPGHVDFSYEVSCAVRICDGALVLIDIVEGLCPQTEVVLRQTWNEGILPCLVINKMDRLFDEVKMTPEQAYYHIINIVDEANAIMESLFTESNVKQSDHPIIFSPTAGNVVFSSGLHGWGFKTSDFAQTFKEKYSISDKNFESSFWGDYYFDWKSKTAQSGAQSKNKTPIFVQFILDNVYKVYKAFNSSDSDVFQQQKIINSICNQNQASSISKISKTSDQYLYLMKRWLPLVDCLLTLCIKTLPSPQFLSDRRIKSLMSTSLIKFKNLPEKSKLLKSDFHKCSSTDDSPVIAFISKMIFYEENYLSRVKFNNQSAERHNFIALTRIFSGKIVSGQKLFVLTPRHIAGSDYSTESREEFTIQDIYILRGKDLILTNNVCAGNIVGIGGLDKMVFKSATLSSTLYCPSFSSRNFEVNPIIGVAIEPVKLSDYENVVAALQILTQSDPILKLTVSDLGEHILNVVGEVHLSKCIQDLLSLLDADKFTVSEPIIPFRESISYHHPDINYPIPSYLKESLNEQDFISEYCKDILSVSSRDKSINIKIRAEYLSPEICEFFEKNQDNIKSYFQNNDNSSLYSEVISIFNSQKHLAIDNIFSRLLCFSKSPSTCILIDNFSTIPLNCLSNKSSAIGNLILSLISGMQLACTSGPLLAEPLTGVAFIIESLELKDNLSNPQDLMLYSCDLSTSGWLTALMKQACHNVLLLSNRIRCCVAFYTCLIRCKIQSLGQIYTVLNKRFGKTVNETLIERTSVFLVEALVPAPEIIGLSEELRCKTSGTVQLQLCFDSWKVVDVDPLNDECVGDSSKLTNVAAYVRGVRKRKGLQLDEKLVPESEKQRTIKRNK